MTDSHEGHSGLGRLGHGIGLIGDVDRLRLALAHGRSEHYVLKRPEADGSSDFAFIALTIPVQPRALHRNQDTEVHKYIHDAKQAKWPRG